MINLKTYNQESHPTTLDVDKQKELFLLGFLEDKAFLDTTVCKKLIDVVELENSFEIGLSRINSKVDYRNNEVCFLDEAKYSEIYKLIIDKINKVNTNFLKFDITHLDRLQYSKYSEDQFLELHDDDYFKYYHQQNHYLLQRKLSVSILLSDLNEYEGGEFEIQANPLDKTYTATLPIGGAIMFPSFLPHRVKKVTKGLRRSLVCWFLGPPWR